MLGTPNPAPLVTDGWGVRKARIAISCGQRGAAVPHGERLDPHQEDDRREKRRREEPAAHEVAADLHDVGDREEDSERDDGVASSPPRKGDGQAPRR